MRFVPSCASAAHPHDGTKKISTQIAPKHCGPGSLPLSALSCWQPWLHGSICTHCSVLSTGDGQQITFFQNIFLPCKADDYSHIFKKTLKKKKRLFVVLMGWDELKLCAIFSALGTKRNGGTENICLIAPRKDCHNILGCISKLNWKSGIYSRPFDQGALQVQESKNTDRWGLELSIRRIISSFNFSSANV